MRNIRRKDYIEKIQTVFCCTSLFTFIHIRNYLSIVKYFVVTMSFGTTVLHKTLICKLSNRTGVLTYFIWSIKNNFVN